jgi:hypothetical protein
MSDLIERLRQAEANREGIGWSNKWWRILLREVIDAFEKDAARITELEAEVNRLRGDPPAKGEDTA